MSLYVNRVVLHCAGATLSEVHGISHSSSIGSMSGGDGFHLWLDEWSILDALGEKGVPQRGAS